MRTEPQISKDALRTDRIYFSPSGPIPISRKRAEHWVKQFQRMSEAGLTVPVPFEHQDAATPGNKRFLGSKQNFGTLTDLTIDEDGQLCFSCSPRDGAVAENAGKLPKFVSPQINDLWTDPSGNVWQDVLTHMALTDTPVNAGQSDRWQILKDKQGQKINRMSLTGQWQMAKFPPADDDDGDDDVSVSIDTDDEDDTDFGQSGGDDNFLRGVNAEDGTDKIFRTVLMELAETCGLVLPEDTTADNFFERAATALLAVKGHKADQEADQPQPDQYTEESNYMGTGVAAMSQATSRPESVRMAAIEAAYQNDRRKQLTKRLQDLVTSGRATPDEAAPRIKAAGTYRLSIQSDGTLAPSIVEAWIESRESLPPGAVWPADQRIERMGFENLPNPMSAAEFEDQQSRAAGVAMAPIQY